MPTEERRKKDPQTTRLRSISPMLTVNDLDTSVAWYRDVLGLYHADTWKAPDGTPIGASLKAGAVDLLLNQDDFAKGRDRAKGIGFRMMAVTAQDLDALAEAIKSRGGTLDHEPTTQPWGTRDFAITDPDGFKITIAAESA